MEFPEDADMKPPGSLYNSRWRHQVMECSHRISQILKIQAYERRMAMLFAILMKVRSGTARERIARRVQWQYPAGAKVVAEYWLMTPDPQVVSIIEADSVAPIMEVIVPWDDVFEFRVSPAITAEEGLKLAKQMMQG
jgi:hypothetical protein